MTEVENKIFEKMKEIKTILEENGENEHFTSFIVNGNIYFHNAYWEKKENQLKINVSVVDGIVERNGENNNE